MNEDVALQTAHMQHLMRVFHFDEDDLRANRDVYMTKRQRARLRMRREEKRLIAFVTGSSGILILLATVYVVMVQSRDLGWIIPFGAVISLVLLFAFVHFYGSKTQLDADLYKGHVSATEGYFLIRRPDELTSGITYPLHLVSVAGVVFEIDHLAYTVMRSQHNRPYAVYYLPNSRTILSLEPLEDNMV